jgi:hypothetical protein
MKRIYHRHEYCEEYKAGMWRNVSAGERQSFIDAAAGLMKDSIRFKSAMIGAMNNWPNSFENSLTSSSINGIAFLGYCGCCYAVNSPEDLTRLAWHTLSTDQQDEANRVAGKVLDMWKSKQMDKELCQSDTLNLQF